jgi:D-alanine-D-alanine ligase
MKIMVLYNRVVSKKIGHPEDLLADEDTVKTAQAIAANLKINHRTKLFEVQENNLKKLTALKPDIFFNNAFGIGSLPKSEADLAGLLEKIGIPFTGSDARAILLTTDKKATKNLLKVNNLPVPGDKKFPLIIKPASEDCSVGISARSVVRTKEELQRQTKRLEKVYKEEVLVEEFIDGRELNVTVLGNNGAARALPISEIVFGPSFEDKYKIVDFSAKWKTDSVAYRETVGVCPADLPPKLAEEIKDLAVAAFLVTGCRDIARVDFRLSRQGKPYILEVNANPGVGPDDGATRSARAAGLTYLQFLEAIVQNALSR